MFQFERRHLQCNDLLFISAIKFQSVHRREHNSVTIFHSTVYVPGLQCLTLHVPLN